MAEQAASLETDADELRASAEMFRRWADVDPLSVQEPTPTPTDEEKAVDALAAWRFLEEFSNNPDVGDLIHLTGKARDGEPFTESERRRFDALTNKEV